MNNQVKQFLSEQHYWFLPHKLSYMKRNPGYVIDWLTRDLVSQIS